MVTARAIIVDLSRGPQLVRSLNLVAGVGGIAPIVGPLIGAVILQLVPLAGVVLGGRGARGA